MIFTESQLRMCADWFAETQARSLSSIPSEFMPLAGEGEINRVFRLEVSDTLGYGIAFLRKYNGVSAIPSDFDPAKLPEDVWTVDDPMVDGIVHEGKYRQSKLRVYRFSEDGREHYFVVQTLSQWFETDARRTYVMEVDGDCTPDLDGVRFYDSGVAYNGDAVHYSEGDVYAAWTHSTLGRIVTVAAQVGHEPTGKFTVSGGTYTGSGGWTGTFTFTEISQTVADFSRFRILSGDYYHANHSQPILRLRNVSPKDADAICEYLNQDSFQDIECFNGTLSGPWYRIRVRQEEQEDGSVHVFLLLAQSANTNLYFKYQAKPGLIRGHYFKWEASEATIAELLGTIRFMPDGEIDEAPYDPDSRTLQETVDGRTVEVRRSVRDEGDRMYDFEIEIEWATGESYPGDPDEGDFIIEYGEPNEVVRFVRSYVGTDLPGNQSLVGDYEDVTVADQYGNPLVLSGRRLVRTRIENARVVDGKFHYDLYEIRTTAPILEHDGWFYAGDGYKPEMQDNRLSVYRAQGMPGEDRLYMLSNPKWRNIYIGRERKFFVRHPTTDDLVAAGAIGATAPIDPTEDNLWEVGQERSGLWYVEKAVVQRDEWEEWKVADGAYSLAGVEKQFVDVSGAGTEM